MISARFCFKHFLSAARAAIFLLFFFHAMPSSATATASATAKTLDGVFATLAAMDSHTGLFRQTRTLAGLSFPIVSEGRFVFARNMGLYNETRKPLFQGLTYSASGIIEWDERGQQVGKKSASPADQYVSEMLLAFFAGNRQHISAIFAIELMPDTSDKSWGIRLTPVRKEIAEYISHISIRGDRHINTINVRAQNGDLTEIAFANIQPITDLAGYCLYFPQTTLATCRQ